MVKHSVVTAAIAGAMVLTTSLPTIAAEGSGRSICLRTNDIDHTTTPDDNTIMFFMHGHKVYKADLINRCVGLDTNTRGFTYSPTIPGSNEICSNLLTIRLNDTGQTCLVGAITPVDLPREKTTP
jgi:hypothetical protein